MLEPITFLYHTVSLYDKIIAVQKDVTRSIYMSLSAL